MKTMGRFAFAAATLLLCTTLMIVLTPKRTEGTVAAAVQVVNPSLAVDTENSGVRIPFLTSVVLSSNGGNLEGAFQVPSTNRLVIEYVSANCNADSAQIVQVQINTDLGPGKAKAASTLPMFVESYSNGYNYAGAQLTHLYAGAGTDVGLHEAVPGGVNFTCAVTVSGYLVNN